VLTEAEEKLKQRREELSAGELEFIQASVALRQGSKQGIYWSLGGIGSILLLAMGIWGWLNYTTLGQLTQIRWQLTDVSQQVRNPKYQSQVAVAFFKDKLNQPEKAASLLDKAIVAANQIPESEYHNKVEALSAIGFGYGKLNQPEKAAPLLEKAIASANQIQESSYKAIALSAIAQAIGKLKQPEKAAPLLEKAIAAANQVPNSNSKARALSAIAEAIGKLNQPEKAASWLEKAIAAANQIQYSDKKADALSAIAIAAANLKNWGRALQAIQQCPTNSCKVKSLAKVLTVHAEQQHPELKEE
jgi:tetratricopeptide (TPR) repeat protein